jgi:hypothetical protein
MKLPDIEHLSVDSLVSLQTNLHKEVEAYNNALKLVLKEISSRELSVKCEHGNVIVTGVRITKTSANSFEIDRKHLRDVADHGLFAMLRDAVGKNPAATVIEVKAQ